MALIAEAPHEYRHGGDIWAYVAAQGLDSAYLIRFRSADEAVRHFGDEYSGRPVGAWRPVPDDVPDDLAATLAWTLGQEG